ncbi:enkurin-like [Elgaria multicarinata webbii]|uniref:enkurin-like n=1 Tax=Elgaria multicarinata webbii TaxID=159646 RepID=UPI002FCCF8AD
MTALYLEENIYNLLPSEETEPIKTQRYVSTFKPLVERETQEKKTAPCKTMGIPKLQVPTPRDFLRKHSKEPKLPKRKRGPGSKRPPELHVPLRTDHPIMGIHSEKNYIATNVAEAIMAVAKKPLHACVDVRKGDKFLIDDSGLVKKYLKKKDFGVTPIYIKKRKKEAKTAQEETDASLEEALEQKGLTRLSREERENVLEGLKHNWEEINQEFQSLSVVIDTVPRKLRKEKMEVQMRQLEHDINILEKHKMIYIANE